jgi:hypothetical protein
VLGSFSTDADDPSAHPVHAFGVITDAAAAVAGYGIVPGRLLAASNIRYFGLIDAGECDAPQLKHAEFRGRIGTARTTVTPPVGIYSRTWEAPSMMWRKACIDLRRQFPDTTVAVLNLSDGTTTYLPKPESLGRDVYQARITFYKPDASARVTEMAPGAIQEMR